MNRKVVLTQDCTIYVHFSFCWCISRLVASINRTCCSRLAFIQTQLDLFRSEENPNLLCYLLVLRYSMWMLWIKSMPGIPYGFMHMPIGWNGLSMPTEACSVCMSIVIINFSLFNTLTHRSHTFCSNRRYLDKNNNTLGMGSAGVTTLNGVYTDYKQKWTFILISRTTTLTPIHARTRTAGLQHLYGGSLL